MAALRYTVAFKGAASETLQAAFDDCEVEFAPGRTLVRCDPALIHDVLERLQSFGLELLDVRLEAAPNEAGPTKPR